MCFDNFRKSQDSQKELKLLLDMYKSVPKEARDKVQVGADKLCRLGIQAILDYRK